MFNKKCGLVLLTLLLLLVSVSGVCATDNNTDSLTTVGDNSLELNNTLCGSDDVDLTNNETTNTVSNDSFDLSTVLCAVESYIGVMDSYNKTVNVEKGIKETHTVNNTTSILGLTNALTKHGLKCNVIKTKSIEDLTTLYKNKKLNIIVHMFIDNQYHFGHIKEIRKNGILFNDNWFVPYHLLKEYYTNISIIITNSSSLNLNCFGVSVNKSKWSNITGKLTQRDLFNYNYGMVGKAINLNNKYVKLKSTLNDDDKKGIAFTEFVLFGNTLKPNMATLLKIQKDLAPIYNNPYAPVKALTISNNVLTPMQHNLNETIRHLNYLIKMINKHCINNDNLKVSNVVSPKVVDVPKLLGDCGEAITENPVLKQFVKNFEDAVNNLNPLNAHPELREYYDEKYGLNHHKFGFIDVYTIKG